MAIIACIIFAVKHRIWPAVLSAVVFVVRFVVNISLLAVNETPTFNWIGLILLIIAICVSDQSKQNEPEVTKKYVAAPTNIGTEWTHYCTTCGTLYKESLHTCQNCLQAGTVVKIPVQGSEPKPSDVTKSQEAPKFCGKCGKPLVEGNKFCTNCGAPIE